MAKKAAEGTINKSEVVRQTLAAGIDNPTEGSKHIKEKFGLDVTAQVFSTIKSITNKKKSGKKKLGRPAGAATAAKPMGPHVVGNGFAKESTDLASGVKGLVERYGAEAVKGMATVFAK